MCRKPADSLLRVAGHRNDNCSLRLFANALAERSGEWWGGFSVFPSAVYKLLFPDEPLYPLSAALVASFVVASCKLFFPSCPSLSHYIFCMSITFLGCNAWAEVPLFIMAHSDHLDEDIGKLLERLAHFCSLFWVFIWFGDLILIQLHLMHNVVVT